ALDEAAAWLDPARPVALADYWATAATVLRLTPLRIADGRHNAVRVLGVREARLWELPVVFVCGVAANLFPRRPLPDAFLSDAARRALGLGDAADRDEEERLLFDLARTRATETAVLSYSETDALGAPSLPSPFLLGREAAQDRWVRPRPRVQPERRAPSSVLRAPRALEVATPSGLECFLDCPFQFFARHALKLTTRPPLPVDRLDALLQGAIVHKVLAESVRRREPLEPLFDEIFRRECTAAAVPRGYRSEYLRRQMLDDLRYFLDDGQLPAGPASVTEQGFEMRLSDSLTVRGRIDRIDATPAGAVIVDYKYSAPQRVLDRARDNNRLQGPLYALAAERALRLRVAGIFYASVRRAAGRREVTIAGWADPATGLRLSGSEPLTREWLAEGESAALDAVQSIRDGRIAPAPSDPDLCRTCDYRDVCRYTPAAAARATP
ncbi:MAG: PD-(D/E)XK nuclease family protein, partial [Bryobacteraceae bacterium]